MSSASLLKAAHDGDREMVAAWLGMGADPNEPDSLGWTALLYAVLAANRAIVDLLIEAGADVNVAAPDGATPLIKAALWGRADIVATLLQAGADPARRDRSGWTAMDLALAGRFAEVATLLHTSALTNKHRRTP